MYTGKQYGNFLLMATNPYHATEQIFKWNWNNYDSLNKISSFPVIGRIASYRAGELRAEENNRYWSDWSKNTGVSLDARKYPIRSGMYSDYSYIGNTLNYSTHAVTRLYKFANPRKTEFTIKNYTTKHNHIQNYGDYNRYDVQNGYFDSYE